MKIHMNTQTYLFIGYAYLPAVLMFLLLISLLIIGNIQGIKCGSVPNWIWDIVYETLPIYMFIVGIVLATFLSFLFKKYEWLTKRRKTRIYLAISIFLWNLIFGFLSFFTFAMGLGDGPPPDSTAELMRNFINVLCFGEPVISLFSIVACLIATTIVVTVLEMILLCFSQPRTNS